MCLSATISCLIIIISEGNINMKREQVENKVSFAIRGFGLNLKLFKGKILL